MKTARMLDLAVPPSLLALADEMIEYEPAMASGHTAQHRVYRDTHDTKSMARDIGTIRWACRVPDISWTRMERRIQMSKINLFAVAAALIVASVGGWVASTPTASVAAPIGVRVDPLPMMINAKDLSTERYHDFSLVFD
jgi:hypothetical protein